MLISTVAHSFDKGKKVKRTDKSKKSRRCSSPYCTNQAKDRRYGHLAHTTQTKKDTTMNNLKGVLAISPLLVFITLYLVTSIIAGDFYKVPISVAFMISGIYAVTIAGGKSLQKNVAAFSRGASAPNIMTMLWIFVLAGAFANSAKAIGAVDATVNTMLSLLPSNMVLPGLFIATAS